MDPRDLRLCVPFILGILVFGFFVGVPAFAAEVFIPSHLARVRDRADGANGKTVVIVEEAHVEFAAQKAVAGTLRDLVQNESFHDIFVEGGWGNVSLDPLKTLAGPDRREEVAEQYLREGKISGEEYLNLATDLDIRLWGIEDPALYQANMDAFLKLDEARPRLLDSIHQIDAQLKNLRAKALTPAMNGLLDRRDDFEAQKISILDYAQFLMEGIRHCEEPAVVSLAGDAAISLPQNGIASLPSGARNDMENFVAKHFPHLAQLVAFAGEGGAYDPDKVTPEKEAAIRFLSARLTKPELEEILWQDSAKTAQDEAAFLDTLLKKAASFPQAREELSLANLRHYRDILLKASGMDAAALFGELDRAFREAFRAQKPTPEQQALFDKTLDLQYLEKLFDLRLTESDYQTMTKSGDSPNLDNFRKAEIGAVPATRQRKENQGGDSHPPRTLADDCPRIVFEYIPVALSFYETARAREKAMVKNLVSAIEGGRIERSVLITGGFHSRNIFKALKEGGYTVLLISPRFAPTDGKAAHEQYLGMLKYKWNGSEAEGPRNKIQEPNINEGPRNKIQGPNDIQMLRSQ